MSSLIVTAGDRSRHVLLVVALIVTNRSCLVRARAWLGGLAMVEEAVGGETERRRRTMGYHAAWSWALQEFWRQAR